MYRQAELLVPERGLRTRIDKLDEKIFELQRIRSLIPAKVDFHKYSLTTEDVQAMFPSSYRIEENFRIDRYRNAANGAMVVLRKRDAENPEMQISYSELREAINVLVDDESFGDAAFLAISMLEGNGLIDTNNWRYVNIVKPKIEGVVSVPF